MEKEKSELLCPVCGYGLASKQLHSQVVDKCFECGGMWLGSEGLSKARHQIDDSIDWPDDLLEYARKIEVRTGRVIICPEDKTVLVSLRYGPSAVMIDICPECSGVWFDAGEFNSFVDDLKSASIDKSSLGYLKDVVHEITEVITGKKGVAEELEDVKKTWHLFKNRLAIDHPVLRNFIEGMGKTFA
jgi:Zn-finger nucleic acid-binding protein